jgi:hypothetical protein
VSSQLTSPLLCIFLYIKVKPWNFSQRPRPKKVITGQAFGLKTQSWSASFLALDFGICHSTINIHKHRINFNVYLFFVAP